VLPQPDAFIALDAGNILSGLLHAQQIQTLGPLIGRREDPSAFNLTQAAFFMKRRIKSFLISHPHLDHLSGLTIISAEDDPAPLAPQKTVIASNFTVEKMVKNIFNWETWPNLASEGASPALNRYRCTLTCIRMLNARSIFKIDCLFHSDLRIPEASEIDIPNTPFSVTAFPLCHGGCFPSTAFVIRVNSEYILYLGDTGADVNEPEPRLSRLWAAVAPLVAAGKLHALFIECSYDDSRSRETLFGHLTPFYLVQEMSNLASKVANISHRSTSDALRTVSVVVTHLKPSFDPNVNFPALIQSQIESHATRMGLASINFRMVQQGVPFIPGE
jgi:cAMP phosphodiesterase